MTSENLRYGMVVDVNRCVGCQTCTISCKHANDTAPDIQWRSVLDVEQGEFPDVSRFFLVVGCQHCAEPPCVPVCPTGATFQRDDGLVVMDYDTCIGCGYCAVACPYQARTIAHEAEFYYGRPTVQETHATHPERIGVAQKCTFCIDRIDEAKDRGLTPGVDSEVTPACAASCIAQAITFGDFNDSDSRVSQLAKGHTFQINDFLKTDPQIKYLYDVPGSIEGLPDTDAHADDIAPGSDPLAGGVQTFWDMRAAMNFILGGMGSGFLLIASAAILSGLATPPAGKALLFAGATLIALGLFFVFLKIGRKGRFLNAIRRPQTSWMTREIYVVAVMFPLIGLALPTDASLSLAALIGIAAAAFLYCQARILHAAKGIPVWRASPVPLLLVATGLAEGAGLYLFASVLVPGAASATWIIVAGVAAGMVTLGTWLWLVRGAKTFRIPPKARQSLALATRVYVPAMIAAAALMVVWPPVGGLLAAISGAAMKAWLITRAAHQQGFVLPAMPRRGSGHRASPSRLNGIQRDKAMSAVGVDPLETV